MESMIRHLLVLTLLAAGLVACSPSAPPRCQPSNCSGCCTDTGACLAFATQAPSTCGSSGAACKACVLGQTCSTGRCVVDPTGGTGGGTGGGSGGGTGGSAGGGCGGLATACCAGNNCFGGLLCTRGVCTAAAQPDAGTTQPCGREAQGCCPGDFCLFPYTCNGTACALADAGTGAFDGGAGTQRALGEACAFHSDCAAGLCQTVSPFTGGYCSRTCASQADCPAGSECARNPSGGSTLCLKDCASPGQSPGGCRSGYVCDKNPALSGVAVCTPGCAGSSSSCGAAPTCDASGLCCGKSGYACCASGPACGSGEACVGGYCQANACGGLSQPCCAANACTASQTACSGGSCVHCGAATQPCCAGSSCATGAVCVSGTCSTCGGLGQPCCASNSCTAGTCTAGTCQSPSLKALGEPCTAASQCADGWCIAELAGANIWIGGYCSKSCAAGAACPAGSSCSSIAVPDPNTPGTNLSMCLKSCSGTGQVTCRNTYVCEHHIIDNNDLQGACFPACATTNECPGKAASGLKCESGYCCGMPYFKCCAGNACTGGTCRADGYCL